MTDVVFALLPNLVLLDVAGPAEAFRIANRLVPGSYTRQMVDRYPELAGIVATSGLPL